MSSLAIQMQKEVFIEVRLRALQASLTDLLLRPNDLSDNDKGKTEQICKIRKDEAREENHQFNHDFKYPNPLFHSPVLMYKQVF